MLWNLEKLFAKC